MGMLPSPRATTASPPAPTPTPTPTPTPEPPPASGGDEVTILFYYSPKGLSDLGGVAAVTAKANSLIQSANQSLSSSGITGSSFKSVGVAAGSQDFEVTSDGGKQAIRGWLPMMELKPRGIPKRLI